MRDSDDVATGGLGSQGGPEGIEAVVKLWEGFSSGWTPRRVGPPACPHTSAEIPRPAAVELTVVELDQAILDLRRIGRAESARDDLGSVPGAGERARKNAKRPLRLSHKCLSDGGGLQAPELGQGRVRTADKEAGGVRLALSMANENQHGNRAPARPPLLTERGFGRTDRSRRSCPQANAR